MNPYLIPGVMRMEVRSATVSRIIDIIENTYGLPYKTMRKKTRKKEICIPRQIAFFWIKYLCPDISLTDIGKMFCRDHATVLHSIKCVKNRDYHQEMQAYFNRSVDKFTVLLWDVQQSKNYN